MIYVYDVLVNLNEEMYDFYDWDESDDYVHVRRVPLFKVSFNQYSDLVNRKVKVSEDFLINIKDKTQVFSSRNIEIIPYSAIFSDGKMAVMVEFNDKGCSLRKSKFLINEEMEILNITNSMKESVVDYNIVNSRANRNNMIRSERNVINVIVKELENLKDDKERIDYLYYEWFDSNEGNLKYEKLLKDLKKSFTSKHLEFLDLLNLLTIQK